MSREKLPLRRPSITLDVAHTYPGNQEPFVFTISVGFYDEAMTRPGEIFVHTMNRSVQKVSVDIHNSCVAVSFALQYGVPMKDLADAMLRDVTNQSHGFMGSMLDAVMQELLTVAGKKDA
jgi:hypothetical protein